MADDKKHNDEELVLSPERAQVVAPAVTDLLADLRSLEGWVGFDLEPMTNAKRWWLDADQE